MSRIGSLPVSLPSGVTVNITDDNQVNLKGPLGEFSVNIDSINKDLLIRPRKDLKLTVAGIFHLNTKYSDNQIKKKLKLDQGIASRYFKLLRQINDLSRQDVNKLKTK